MAVGLYSQDGDHGDDDNDEDGPREADLEGRVEKYIGVKVKARNFLTHEYISSTGKKKGLFFSLF